LKKEDANKAWNYLIEAQDWAKSSTHTKPLERSQQEDYIEKLHQIEKVYSFHQRPSLVLVMSLKVYSAQFVKRIMEIVTILQAKRTWEDFARASNGV
jgi:hypothetical protein